MNELSEKKEFGNKPWKPPSHKDKLFTAREVADSYVEGFKDGYLQARQDFLDGQGHDPDHSPEGG